MEMVGELTFPITMVHAIRVESGHGIISRPLVHIPEPFSDLIANHTPPPPTLEVHARDAHPRPPPLAKLLAEVLIPSGRKIEIARVGRWEGVYEGSECEVVVSGEEHVALVRPRGRQRDEPIEDFASLRAAIVVIAQKNDGAVSECFGSHTCFE